MKIWQGVSFFFLFLLDFASKLALLAYLPSSGVSFFQSAPFSFSLNLVFNTGAAWGLFPGHPELLFSLRIGIVLGVLLYLFYKKKERFPLSLLVTGAIGNIFDYVLYGHVVDFLHFQFWGHSFPIFNFADCYITIAFFWLFCFGEKRGSSATNQHLACFKQTTERRD
ncbi:MAG TPA: signal peptidase II [Chlamydiales bacterium]|nr:signal peptidase II [Chlamydiales bacterium]